MTLADLTQHDVVWVLLVLAIVALAMFILGYRR